MSMTEFLTQELASPATSLNALSRTAATYNTGAVDLSKTRQVLFIVDSGNASTAGGTIDFKLQGCATSGGSFVDIPNTSITQLTANAKFTFVLVNQAWLVNQGLGYQFVEGKLTVGTATTVCGVYVLASDARFEPTSLQNITAVSQILALAI